MTAASLLRDLTAFSMQIALVALGVAVLLKLVRIPAGARYLGLRLALMASLLVPWLLRAPEVQAPALAAPATQAVVAAPVPATGTPSAPARQAATAAPLAASMPAIPWMEIGFGALLVGIAARVVWLGMGVLRLLRMKRDGVVVDAPEYSELQQQLGTDATIAQVAGLPQPATFGVRRPTVLLPDALADATASLRRAVVTHELFHVRRRDWLAVLSEEMVRTVLWFHPGIHWMTAQIQLAREEIVDELTVSATGDRRTYVEALLAFADTPGLSPAPAFAHRRQLFHRILSVSKEKVMSRPRIVYSAVALAAAVSGASWYASTVFPILEAAKADASPQVSTPSGSRVEGPGRQMSIAELRQEMVELRTSAMALSGADAAALLDQRNGEVIAMRPITPENPIPRRTRGVAPVTPSQYSSTQVVLSARVTVDRTGAVTSVDPDSCSASGGQNDSAVCAAFQNAAAAAVRQWRYDRPAQAPIQFYVKVTFRPGAEATIAQSGESYLRDTQGSVLRETQDSLRVLAEQARRGDRVATDDFLKAQLAGLAAQYRELERAQRLAVERGPANPDLVKLQAELARMNDEVVRVEGQIRSTKRAEEVRALDEQLRAAQRQLEATRAGQAVEDQARTDQQRREWEQFLRDVREQVAQLNQTGTATVSPTPTTPFDGSQQLKSPSGRAPIRVTPPMPPPVPTKRVNPQYPPIAKEARVQGTVAVEILVDEKGHVAGARVLRSIPLLDQSALDAAKQWEFTVTLMNGEPVPVLLQLEMSFTLK